jgi:hypothetical protein
MKTITTLLSLCAALIAFSAVAEVKLEDNSKVLGKWRVNAESLALDKEKKTLNVSWEFQNNGFLRTIAEDTLGRTSEMDITVKYSVEGGIIKKQVSPGREKYEDCAVISLEGKDMTLRCRNLFFFMSRK